MFKFVILFLLHIRAKVRLERCWEIYIASFEDGYVVSRENEKDNSNSVLNGIIIQ